MTKEEKDLLFKDLAPRLPYGVKVHIPFLNHVETLIGLDIIDGEIRKNGYISDGEIRINGYISDVKPYLRPMSSMTEEERKEYKHLVAFSGSPDGAANFIDWLNAHHFDYRGLIEKGLALEAPEGMYQ